MSLVCALGYADDSQQKVSRGSLSAEVSNQGLTIPAAEILTAASIDNSSKFPFDNNRDIRYFLFS